MVDAIKMLFDAHRDGDPFRVEMALRSLEFWQSLKEAQQWAKR